MLFIGALHSDAYIFPFLLCFSLLFFSQLFVRPPQTAILLFFSMGMVLIPVSCTMSRTSIHSSSDTLIYIYKRRQWHPTPVLLPGNSHGRRSLVGYSPWGRQESDMTERLYFHFSLSCIGEGNGNPLQCSCLENPRDGGACWLPSMGSHRVGHD